MDILRKQGYNIGGGGESDTNFVGTRAEWDALTQSQKAEYDGKLVNIIDDTLQSIIAPNAGSHNSIYRGKYLGSSVTAAQYASISAGTFEDLFIGDYWTIGGVNYRIAAFDYWLNTGNVECTDHHVVLVPDTSLYTAKMNDTDITTGGYVSSAMYTTNLNDAKTTINNAFGSAHILTHRAVLTTSVSTGSASGWGWRDSTVELMNEVMVYGCTSGSKPIANSPNYDIGIDKTQLPLFVLEPSRIANRTNWWLRSIVSTTTFANVNTYGFANANNASDTHSVRPAFAIIG